MPHILKIRIGGTRRDIMRKFGPKKDPDLAFDHNNIVEETLKYLKKN